MPHTPSLLTFLVGPPGAGKTTSLRNLEKDAIVFNTEGKMLPYRPRHALQPVGTTEKMMEYLTLLQKSTKYRIVVIDSFSAFADTLLSEARLMYKGFDVWNHYNEMIDRFMRALKSLSGKYVFVTGHVETLMDADQNKVQRMKVAGKQNEGVMERHPTCVFYCRVVPKPNGRGADYFFITNTDGYLPAKTPIGMFSEFMIPNDLAQIVHAYDAYYREPENAATPENSLNP